MAVEIGLYAESLLTIVKSLVNRNARVDGITLRKRIFSLTSSKFDILPLIVKLI